MGTLHPDSLRPLVETYLASLPGSGARETFRDLGIRPPAGVVQRTVRRGVEPKARTVLVFTGPAEFSRQASADMSALAEALELRLREKLREELGGTYSVGVSGSVARDPYPRYSLNIDFGSAPERVDELVRVVMAEIDTVRAAGVPQDVVDKVREAFRRSRETDDARERHLDGAADGVRPPRLGPAPDQREPGRRTSARSACAPPRACTWTPRAACRCRWCRRPERRRQAAPRRRRALTRSLMLAPSPASGRGYKRRRIPAAFPHLSFRRSAARNPVLPLKSGRDRGIYRRDSRDRTGARHLRLQPAIPRGCASTTCAEMAESRFLSRAMNLCRRKVQRGAPSE